MSDRQQKAVTEALYQVAMCDTIPTGDPFLDNPEECAAAAIAASDAQYVPMLVEALKYYRYLEPEGCMARLTLAKLPEDLK